MEIFLSEFEEPIHSRVLEPGRCLAVVFRPDILHFGQRNISSDKNVKKDQLRQVIFGSFRSISNDEKREKLIQKDKSDRRDDYQYYPIALQTIFGNKDKATQIWTTDQDK